MTTGAVEAWVRHLVTRGTSVEAPPPDPRTLADEWEAVALHATRGRITGALVDVAEAHGGVIGPERVALAKSAHLGAVGVALRLERLLLDVTHRLTAAGIRSVVLKGPAVAHLDHADPADRDFGDLDLLVPPDVMSDAVQVLDEAGHRRLLPPAHPDLDRVFAKSVTLRTREGLEVDLHRTLTTGAFGQLLPLDRVWSELTTFDLAGTPLNALDGPSRLVHTAAHLRLGGSAPRLSTRRDLLVQCDRIMVSDAVRTASELGLAVVLQAALRLCTDAGTPPPTAYRAWADSHVPSTAERRRLDRHVAALDEFRGRTAWALREVGWRDRLLIVRALAFPDVEHLAARGLTRRQHLRHIFRRG